ncbi:MAG: ribosomal L7Ae/L30e/S12e/Gadd45 family protein [Candidatus Nanopusillus acidilobi]|jgi:large subunit ribosomal protein L30e|nr:ribosomal L7Ae/L30e/S12e/Gadd45 family protein [Candidatus Nanopusillus sp.]MCG2868736.1 ribosomal L7Ae/L30e/S12e/Gadd45 family protein [Candidatus Nanopusillus sp.]MCG2883166.1 ribosomal L7Ae/L30e/S12e/Gadd45 family protein [Candidatus Nanopusillus sp.]
MVTFDDLRKKIVDEKRIVIGYNRTLKKIKRGEVEKVFLAKNVPENIKKDIEYYQKLGNFEVEVLNYSNEEVGLLLKKPFKISVISILKNG